MSVVLTSNSYGKSSVRLLKVVRDGARHEIRDLTVDIALEGDFELVHTHGDNSTVLPTDTMKNTVYAFAKEHGVGEPEAFGLLLARHFVRTQPQVHAAKVSIEAFAWKRLGPHSFQRSDDFTRTALINVSETDAQVVSGISGLILLNSTASEFRGYPKDRYTTLKETTDRVLATAVDAKWRHLSDKSDWADSFVGATDALTNAFVNTYSHSLQQTLLSMGSWLLESRPEIAEVRLALPNKHHYLVDLTPFDLENDNEVFIAGDRPYGLIEGTVTRDDAPPASAEWY
jgi:urate oxidase